MLPIIATPKYEMIVPSTGESITYRPYVVKEEKILLIAMESQSDEAIENAVSDIITRCVETPIKVKDLTTFDVEYMFVTLRSKSVGEGIKVTPKCEHCEETNEQKIDLEKVRVKNLEDQVDRHIKLTDDISLDLRWQTMSDKLTDKERNTQTDTLINMIAKSIETIYSGEETFVAKDSSKKELVDFVESLNTDQFGDIIDVIAKSPVLSYDLKFKCKECGKNNEKELRGLIDFF